MEALKAWVNADGSTTAPTGATVTYTLYADILDAKVKYYKTVVFTVKVPVVLKPVPKVSAAFAK